MFHNILIKVSIIKSLFQRIGEIIFCHLYKTLVKITIKNLNSFIVEIA